MAPSNRFAGSSLRCRVVWPLAVLVVLQSVGPAITSAGPPVYERKSTWAETVLASREPHAGWWRSQLGDAKLGPWHTTELEDVHSLRQPVKLTSLDKRGNRRWQVRPELIDGVVHYDLSNHGINQQRRSTTWPILWLSNASPCWRTLCLILTACC